MSDVIYRWVVIVQEHYDMYEVQMPYPIQTSLTREDLQDELREFDMDVRSVYAASDKFYHCSHILDLGGTGLMVAWLDNLEGYGPERDFVMPPIMSVEEWFGAGACDPGM